MRTPLYVLLLGVALAIPAFGDEPDPYTPMACVQLDDASVIVVNREGGATFRGPSGDFTSEVVRTSVEHGSSLGVKYTSIRYELESGAALTVNLFPTHGIGVLAHAERELEVRFDSCGR